MPKLKQCKPIFGLRKFSRNFQLKFKGALILRQKKKKLNNPLICVFKVGTDFWKVFGLFVASSRTKQIKAFQPQLCAMLRPSLLENLVCISDTCKWQMNARAEFLSASKERKKKTVGSCKQKWRSMPQNTHTCQLGMCVISTQKFKYNGIWNATLF